jgi:signal transduction histidine kinase
VQLRGLERWISLVRLIAFPFVLVSVAIASYPPGRWELWAWVTTGLFLVGSIAFFVVARSELGNAHPFAQSLAAQIFDTAIITGYVMVFAFERGLPVQQILYIDLAAACVRFGIKGGLVLAAVSAPIVAVFGKLRADQLNATFSWKLVVFQTGLEVLMALIVGWLVQKLAAAGAQAEARAEEAEALHEAERRTVAELRRLSSLRADFVSLVSHEVRTPMAAVIGSARTLQRRWRDLTAEQRDAFLALIADETDRLAALVGEVLDTSRIDAGTFSYTFDDELDLAGLINETVATAELARSELRITTRVPSDLPAVRGDSLRLRQVLTNLIDNAVKYSGEGEPVEVRVTAVNNHATVEVVDHGSGIPPEDQQLIFEKFGRVRGTSSKPGTGLGLYIARAIAEAHGGTLDVKSEPGEGSTFALNLPLRNGSLNAAGRPRS